MSHTRPMVWLTERTKVEDRKGSWNIRMAVLVRDVQCPLLNHSNSEMYFLWTRAKGCCVPMWLCYCPQKTCFVLLLYSGLAIPHQSFQCLGQGTGCTVTQRNNTPALTLCPPDRIFVNKEAQVWRWNHENHELLQFGLGEFSLLRIFWYAQLQVRTTKAGRRC